MLLGESIGCEIDSPYSTESFGKEEADEEYDICNIEERLSIF